MVYVRDLVYLLLLVACSPWLAWKAWRTQKYRSGWGQKLFGRTPRRHGTRPCIWFHAVSVGEVNLLAPLISRWEKQHPDWDCVISTTTRTGYELAHQKYAPRQVFYAPLDFSWAVRRTLRRIRPNLIVLAELEVWPNWIQAAHNRDIPVAIINGRLSDKSFRGYHRLRFFLTSTFQKLSLVAAQNDEVGSRFQKLGTPPERIVTTGSVKFDGIRTDRNHPQTARLAALAGLQSNDLVFLAGSTQEGEESAALEAYLANREHFPSLKLILVPRHPERFDAVAKMLGERGAEFVRRSELSVTNPNPSAPILLVDAIGELAAWWGTAHIAFVGGSFTNRGGQNMIEPAGYGAAVSFGPNTWNFRDVVERFLAADAAIVVQNPQELNQFVTRMLENPVERHALGERARSLVLSQLGAADQTIALLAEVTQGRPIPSLRPLPSANAA